MSRADSHPHRWQEVFRACKREADTLAAGLSPEAFNRAPADGVWSVGQCLDHLLEAGQPLVASLETALAAAPAAAPGAELRLGLRDRLFVWAVQPHHWLTMPSPGAYRPSDETLDPERTLRAFAALQDDLAACADAAAGRDWSAVRVASPASRFVRLSAGGWLEGTLQHQRRHLRQARRAREAAGG
jgi:hypothetical protein